jgi:hypothetical protein
MAILNEQSLRMQRLAGIITEAQYLKGLNEGTIQLTQSERDQLEDLMPKIISIIQGPIIDKTEFKVAGQINYEFADKTQGKTMIYIGNDQPNSNGYFQTQDPKNPEDNYIAIQQSNFLPYFQNILAKGYNTLTGDKNQGIELLRKTLKHELIHAKDPALNHRYLKEPYDPNKPEVYYKSWTEFQTMTGQFFESITSGVDRIIKEDPSRENVDKIKKILDEILNFYAGKSKTLSQNVMDFIQGTDKRNIFQKTIKSIENVLSNIVGMKVPNALDVYMIYINQIKKYNPEGYKEFLKDLYKTISEIKNKISK